MRIAIAIAATTVVLPVSAEQIALKELGVLVELPQQWTVSKGGDDARRWALFRPVRQDDKNNVVACRVDKSQLPERYRSLTQAEINNGQERAALTAPQFAERIQQMSGTKATVLETGHGLLDIAHGSWAVATSVERVGTTTAYYKMKIALPQTPGYGWNLQCLVASTQGAAGADALFSANKPAIDHFYQSFKFLPAR